jgi:hypothetical protein
MKLIISLVKQTYMQHFAKRMADRLRASLGDVHRGARKAPAAILDALPDLSMTRDGAFAGRLLLNLDVSGIRGCVRNRENTQRQAQDLVVFSSVPG